jgi:hypothetical protein
MGGPRADWFNQALGFTRDNAAELESQLIFDPGKAVQTGVAQFGTTYNRVIPITGANGKTIDVLFGWTRNYDGVAHLMTTIPTKR